MRLGDREAHVLDTGEVWGCSSGDDVRTTSSFRITLLDFGPPLHPHGQMFSNLQLAVRGPDGMLTSPNLRSSKSRDLGRTSVGISPLRGQCHQK